MRNPDPPRVVRVGVAGTGFIARGFTLAAARSRDLRVARVLTRRAPAAVSEFPRPDLLTRSVDALIEASDLVLECSGDPIHATEVVHRALEASRPVVTMNAEFQVTTGSYFAGRGLLTEAHGDQPGCLAALREEVVRAGFRPLVYGNIKRFLDRQPTRPQMEHWARRQGIRLPQVIAFTDGTKVQIEQALVANGLGAEIAAPGLLGIASEDLEAGARALAERARALGGPISDYVLSPKAPAGVFIVAEHDAEQADYLRYLKLGEGPWYVLTRNYHLCHLEIESTVRRVLGGEGVLLDNSPAPRIGVAAIAKRRIAAGERIERGIGSFETRGETVRIREVPEHVPIGLLAGAVAVRDIAAGGLICSDDVELPDSFAARVWKEILAGVPHDDPHAA